MTCDFAACREIPKLKSEFWTFRLWYRRYDRLLKNA